MALQQSTHSYLFFPITKNYQVESFIFNKPNQSLTDKTMIEKAFNINVQQVSKNDFINIAFPNAQGQFCFFFKGKKFVKNVFVKTNELKDKLSTLLAENQLVNGYISYSTYYTDYLGHTKAQEPVVFGETVSTACRMDTREEYVITKEVKKRKTVRTQKNIVQTYLLAQDLDYYKNGISHDKALSIIARLVQEEKIIMPTFLNFTGQGIQLIWAVKPFSNIKGYTYDLDWRAIQEKMYQIFAKEGLKPDVVVKNPSAVTRMTETIHQQSHALVRTFYANAAALTLSDFTFFYGLTPKPDLTVKPPKKKTVPVQTKGKVITFVKGWNSYTLNEERLNDIFRYIEEMKKKNISLIGRRSWLSTILRFHAIVSSGGDYNYALNEVKKLWESFPDKRDNSFEEITARSKVAERYYEEWQEDKWDKTKYVRGGYFYSNERLVEILKIEEMFDVQLKMKTIKISNPLLYKEKLEKCKDPATVHRYIELIKRAEQYQAYRKRVEMYGEEEQHNHTWEKELERRKATGQAHTDKRVEALKSILNDKPNIKKKEIASIMGISDRHLRRIWKQLEQ
jgi:hypothetical protein